MKSGSRSCALAAASSSALGINRRKVTHTSTSIWAMPVRSAAPIACRERRLLWFHKHFLNLGVKAALAINEESTRRHERQNEAGPRWYSDFNPHHLWG